MHTSKLFVAWHSGSPEVEFCSMSLCHIRHMAARTTAAVRSPSEVRSPLSEAMAKRDGLGGGSAGASPNGNEPPGAASPPLTDSRGKGQGQNTNTHRTALHRTACWLHRSTLSRSSERDDTVSRHCFTLCSALRAGGR